MTEMRLFNAAFPRIPLFNQLTLSSSMIYNRFVIYCGVDWNRRCVRITEEFLESLELGSSQEPRNIPRQSDALFEHFLIP